MEMMHQAEGRRAEVRRVASELFRQNPDWVTFFREILGVDGIVRRLFPTADEIERIRAVRGVLGATADGGSPARR